MTLSEGIKRGILSYLSCFTSGTGYGRTYERDERSKNALHKAKWNKHCILIGIVAVAQDEFARFISKTSVTLFVAVIKIMSITGNIF